MAVPQRPPGPHGAPEPRRCLVTGATGYIGGRLVPELLAAGHQVRCVARSPEKLRDHPWAGRVETVRGDVTDEESVRAAME
ncbi:SDR family NAD(P)-dependent oxidoreductase, partial [Streptomyces rubiginosohelvolus]